MNGLYMKYILSVSKRNYLSNDDFSVFNTYLPWIFIVFKKNSQKKNLIFLDIDFYFMHQCTQYEEYIKYLYEGFLSNEDFPVFNTHLMWFLMDLKKFDEKLHFNLFNVDF